MEHNGVVANQDELTSAELDEHLDEAETLSVGHPAGSTEVRLYVAVDAETLRELEQRATRTGTAVAVAASDALRAGAGAA